jgi:hypothetical protein
VRHVSKQPKASNRDEFGVILVISPTAADNSLLALAARHGTHARVCVCVKEIWGGGGSGLAQKTAIIDVKIALDSFISRTQTYGKLCNHYSQSSARVLFVCCLYNDAISTWCYMSRNDRMTHE